MILTEYEGSHYLYQMQNTMNWNLNGGIVPNSNLYSNSNLNFTDIIARLVSPYLRPDSNLGALSSAIFYNYFTDYVQKPNRITNKQIFDQEAFQITATVGV